LDIEEKKSITSSYKGKSLRLLTQFGISLGDTLKLNISGNQFTGILMPRYESADQNHLVIKLKSGYNIGVELTKIESITKIMQESNQNVSAMPSSLLPPSSSIPEASIKRARRGRG
jgi:hypothetical protein